MLLMLLAGVALASVPLAGGSLLRLVEIEVRWLWAMGATIVLQVLVLGVLAERPTALLALGHVASYLAAFAFVWVNRRIPGLGLIALGGLLNFAAITANGGVMPATEHAVRAAGIIDRPGVYENSAVVEDPGLWFLGDVFAIPSSWPLANVFSVGDVVLFVGVLWFAHRVAGSRLVPRWLRSTGAHAAPPRWRSAVLDAGARSQQ